MELYLIYTGFYPFTWFQDTERSWIFSHGKLLQKFENPSKNLSVSSQLQTSKAPNETSVFFLQTCHSQKWGWHRQHTSPRRRWQSSGRPSAKLVSAAKCEPVACSFLMVWLTSYEEMEFAPSVLSHQPQKALFLPLQASQMKPHQLTAEHWPLTEGELGLQQVLWKNSKAV